MFMRANALLHHIVASSSFFSSASPYNLAASVKFFSVIACYISGMDCRDAIGKLLNSSLAFALRAAAAALLSSDVALIRTLRRFYDTRSGDLRNRREESRL